MPHPFVPTLPTRAAAAAASDARPTAPPTAPEPPSPSPERFTPAGLEPERVTPTAFVPAAFVPTAHAPHEAPVDAGEPLPAALGPLAEYVRDPAVTDVFVNGAAGLWLDRGAGARRDPLWRADEDSVRDLAVALVAAGGRHLDDANPCVDVRLEDGVRVHAVLPPVAATGTHVSVRIPRMRRPRLERFAAADGFGEPVVRWLRETVRDRANVLITGAAGTGKTTLLAALLAEAGAHERIVTIEDVAELYIDHPHHVALEARQANLEGAGAIELSRLVREALRMRPDRIVLGECRGAEIRELLSALNTGHDGGAGTLHANGLPDVPARLEALGALAGWDDRALARQAVSAIGVVLHLERDDGGVRRLAAAGRLVLEDGRLAVREETPWHA